ncbi:MAG: hypothetical protein ACQEP8_03475 [Chlamydiota bacterium]
MSWREFRLLGFLFLFPLLSISFSVLYLPSLFPFWLIFFGVSLDLLRCYFRHIGQFCDPLYALNLVEKSIKNLDLTEVAHKSDIHDKVTQLSLIGQEAIDEGNGSLALKAVKAIESTSHSCLFSEHSQEIYLEEVMYFASSLNDIALRSLAKGHLNIAQETCDAMANITKQYIDFSVAYNALEDDATYDFSANLTEIAIKSIYQGHYHFANQIVKLHIESFTRTILESCLNEEKDHAELALWTGCLQKIYRNLKLINEHAAAYNVPAVCESIANILSFTTLYLISSYGFSATALMPLVFFNKCVNDCLKSNMSPYYAVVPLQVLSEELADHLAEEGENILHIYQALIELLLEIGKQTLALSWSKTNFVTQAEIESITDTFSKIIAMLEKRDPDNDKTAAKILATTQRAYQEIITSAEQ